MNKLRNITICTLSVITLLVISGCNNSSSAQESTGKDSVIPVEVSKVQDELLVIGNIYSGVIKPSEEIQIVPKLPGTVVELPVDVGDRVTKGQVLLKLDDKEISNSVKTAEAAEAAAEANIGSAETGHESNVIQSETGVIQAKNSMLQAENGMVQAKDAVTKAESAVSTAQNALEDSKLTLQKAQVVLNDAQINYDRMKQLFEGSIISKADFEKSESALKTAQANFDSVTLASKNAETGLATAKKALEAAKQTYTNTTKGYQAASEAYSKAQEQAQIAQDTSTIQASEEAWKQSQVALEVAKDKLNDTTITSPIDGIIGFKYTDVSEQVSTQSPALVVVNMDKVKVLTYIPSEEINNVKPGDQVQVKTLSINNVTYGKVKTISPLDENGKGYPVEVEIDNPDLTLKSGMVVDLQFVTDDAPEGKLIPSSAVFDKDGKSYVYVVEDRHPVRHEIKIGDKKGSMVLVTSGLKNNALVITDNLEFLTPEVEVSYE
ncbi:secretion protein HlyD [Lysinibacillus sp. PLM2]|nr:secretion protein HlyD [Lysinibacillus sp. PLM2]